MYCTCTSSVVNYGSADQKNNGGSNYLSQKVVCTKLQVRTVSLMSVGDLAGKLWHVPSNQQALL